MLEHTEAAADRLASSLAGRARVIQICWIVLSLGLFATVAGAIAGAWNFYVIIKQWWLPGAIRARSVAVVRRYQGDSGHWLTWGLINLVLGGGIGVLLIAAEYFLVRNPIVKNRAIFNRSGW